MAIMVADTVKQPQIGTVTMCIIVARSNVFVLFFCFKYSVSFIYSSNTIDHSSRMAKGDG